MHKCIWCIYSVQYVARREVEKEAKTLLNSACVLFRCVHRSRPTLARSLALTHAVIAAHTDTHRHNVAVLGLLRRARARKECARSSASALHALCRRRRTGVCLLLHCCCWAHKVKLYAAAAATRNRGVGLVLVGWW